MSKLDLLLAAEAKRLRKAADREERAIRRRGDDPAHSAVIRLNRIYADRIDAELAGGAL